MAKSTGSSGWRQKSTGFLASIAAVALIVALLGGMAIGYAIEKNRVKPAAKTALKKPVAKKPVTVKALRVGGTVDTASATSITVTPKKGAKAKITIAKATTVVKAASGASADIAADSKVIFIGAGSFTKATAVIVLPKNAKLGTVVSAVDSGSMTLKNGTKTRKIETTGASVEKVSPAKASDITKDSKVMVQAVRTKAGLLIATEIIILPSDTKFV